MSHFTDLPAISADSDLPFRLRVGGGNAGKVSSPARTSGFVWVEKTKQWYWRILREVGVDRVGDSRLKDGPTAEAWS